MNRTRLALQIVSLVLAVIALVGCAGPSLDGINATIDGTPANQATFIDPETGQRWNVQQHGAPAAIVTTDANGSEKQSAGMSRTVTLSFDPSGLISLSMDDPLDGSLRGLESEFTPDGGFRVNVEEVSARPSDTYDSLSPATIEALEQAGAISAQNAQTMRELVATGMPVAEAILSVLLGAGI